MIFSFWRTNPLTLTACKKSVLSYFIYLNCIDLICFIILLLFTVFFCKFNSVWNQASLCCVWAIATELPCCKDKHTEWAND